MFKKGATAADKKGILAGKGGDWKLDRAGTPVNPETTLASSVVGWHSKKTVKIMTAQNTTIPPRETVIDGEVFQSPNIYGKRKSHLVGRIEHLNQSWATGGWRKRLEKYLKSQPFQKGFLVRGKVLYVFKLWPEEFLLYEPLLDRARCARLSSDLMKDVY